MSHGNWNANQAQVMKKIELNHYLSFNYRFLQDYETHMLFPETHVVLRTTQIKVWFFFCDIQYVPRKLEFKSNTRDVED